MKHYRTWPIFLTAFATLSALTGGVGFYAFRVGQTAHADSAVIHEAHRRKADALNRIEALLWRSAIVVRDAVLAGGAPSGAAWRGEYTGVRAAVEQQMESLRREFGQPLPELYSRLRRELDDYWSSQELFLAGPRGRGGRLDTAVLSRELVPRRLAVLSVAHEINELNQASLRAEAERTAESLLRSRRLLRPLFGGAGLLALAVAGLAALRLWRLEREWERERGRALEAREALRRLSQEVVRAQEEERRSISRELHDEVGQALTALRLELGGLERLRFGAEEPLWQRLAEAKALVEGALQNVRDLAMGLRPSMLDDLGLEPALAWQAREFSRHAAIPAELSCDSDLGELPDRVRTCLYRVTQEALTNCARHARATTVGISVSRRNGRATLTVEDDGVGFDPADERGRGLGLLGIEERVRELGGKVSLSSRLYRGTRLRVEIPLDEGERA